MIEWMFGFAAILAIALKGGKLYISKATDYLREAEKISERMFSASHQILADETISSDIKRFVVSSTLVSGCGCLATHAIFERLSAGFRREMHHSDVTTIRQEIANLKPEQRSLLRTVVLDSVLYDSLRAPLRGYILRKFFMPRLDHDRRAMSPNMVIEIAASNKEFVERKAVAQRVRGDLIPA